MVKDEDFTIEDYQKKVEKIVNSLPYMVFVNNVKTEEKTIQEVQSKMEMLRKYGAGKLILHALSYGNVQKARRILAHFAAKNVEVEMDDKKTHITATLTF